MRFSLGISSSLTIGLFVGAVLALLGVALANAHLADAKRKSCGTYSIKRTKHNLVIRKGSPSCSTAKKVVKSGRKKRNCGRPSQQTCDALGNWQCQSIYSQDTERVKGPFYCFVPRKVRDQTSPVDFWKPGKYSRVVVLEYR